VEGSEIFVEGVRSFLLLELSADGVDGRAIPVKVKGEEWRKPPTPIDTFRVELPARAPAG
jgi:hypothetical protein